jgi:hypothetical protein
MKELRLISSILYSINNGLSDVFNSCNSPEIQDSVRDARSNLIQSACALEYAYRCSISKGSHEPSLPSIPGKSVASEQPVHGES